MVWISIASSSRSSRRKHCSTVSSFSNFPTGYSYVSSYLPPFFSLADKNIPVFLEYADCYFYHFIPFNGIEYIETPIKFRWFSYCNYSEIDKRARYRYWWLNSWRSSLSCCIFVTNVKLLRSLAFIFVIHQFLELEYLKASSEVFILFFRILQQVIAYVNLKFSLIIPDLLIERILFYLGQCQ